MRVINIKNNRHLQIYLTLAILLLLGCSSLHAKQTYENNSILIAYAQKQQKKMIDDHGLSQQPKWLNKCNEMIETLQLDQFVECLVIKATFANAYSLAHGTVVLTDGLLKNINNDHQFAHILAHEHAHLTLKHHQQAQQLVKNPPKFFTKSRIKKFYRQIEQQADQSADQLLTQQQFDPLQIHHYLMRIEQNSQEHSNDHQKLKERIKRNGLPVEKREKFWTNR